MSIQAQSADGTTHEFPEGTSDAVVDRVMKSYAGQMKRRNVNARPADDMLMSAGKGGAAWLTDAVFEVQKGAGYGAKALGYPQTGQGLIDKANVAERAVDAAMRPDREAHPIATGAGELVGAAFAPLGAVSKLAKAASPLARAAIAGGTAGALTSTSESTNYAADKAQQVAGGAVAGAGFAKAGELAGRGINAALQTPAGRGVSAAWQGVAHWLGRVAPDAIHDAALQKVMQRFEHDEAGGGPSAAHVMQTVEAARAAGKPMAIADVAGKNVQGLAGSVARAPGPSKAYVEQAVQDRTAGAGDRLSADVTQHLTSGPSMRQSADALTAGQRASAAPLYSKAFDTASRGPLTPVLERHITEATTKEAKAAATVTEAKAALSGPPKPAPTPPASRERVGPSLLEFIAKRGGVIDQGGDLKAMDADRWHLGKPGRKKLLADAPDAGSAIPGMMKPGSGKRDGRGLDDMARTAWEAGYLHGVDRPDVNALLDAMGTELRGEKVHTMEDHHILNARDDAARYADWMDQHRDTVRAAAEDRGVSLHKAEEHHAAQLVAEGTHPDQAIEDAGQSFHMDRLIRDEQRSAQAYQRNRLAKAQADVTEAQQTRKAASEAMTAAKADQAAGIKGGIWSPRVQQFLDDPIIKQGIGKGLEIQRLGALADGRTFDPKDYAVTGVDEAGNPQVGKVPNMRLLDAAKKGLDAILEGYREPVTGRMNLDERGRAVDQVRRAFVGELDKLNPDYAAARAAWAGPAEAKGALTSGRAILSRHPEDIARSFGKLSPANREFYRLGVADALRDAIAKKSVTAETVRGLARNSHNSMVKEQLRVIFPSQAKFEAFLDAVTAERTMFERGQKVLAGSQTAERLAEDGGSRLGAAMHAAHGVGHAASGNALAAIASFARLKRDLGVQNNPDMNMALAKLLFDPTANLAPAPMNGVNTLRQAAAIMPVTRNHLAQMMQQAAPLAGTGAAQALPPQ